MKMSVLALAYELGQDVTNAISFVFNEVMSHSLVNYLDDLASANTSDPIDSSFLTFGTLMIELGLDINERQLSSDKDLYQEVDIDIWLL